MMESGRARYRALAGFPHPAMRKPTTICTTYGCMEPILGIR